MSTVERYSNWNVDELIILDISRGDDRHDLRRDDLQQNYVGNSAIDVLKAIAQVCFMPLTFGGRIKSIADIEILVDKIGDGMCGITHFLVHLNQPRYLDKPIKNDNKYGQHEHKLNKGNTAFISVESF